MQEKKHRGLRGQLDALVGHICHNLQHLRLLLPFILVHSTNERCHSKMQVAGKGLAKLFQPLQLLQA